MVFSWSGAKRRWLTCVVAMLLVVGCATPQQIIGDEQAFSRTGRFAVSVDHRLGKHEAVQGGFAWHDSGDALRLNLANPLGTTLAQVRVEKNLAVLTRSDGSTQTAPDAESLVDQALGGPIPVAGLRHWLHGELGDEPASNVQVNASGELESFEQDGWQVALSRYDGSGPRTISLRRSDHHRVIRVRLVIDGS